MKVQVIKARPTTYKGIKMRSRLEAYFAAFLDDMEMEWEYEPTCFAGPAGQWLPDFKVTDGRSEYIELKPWIMAPVPYEPFIQEEWQAGYDRQVAVDAVLTRMETAWLSVEERASLTLYFAEVENGKIGRYMSIMCDRPGEPWRFGLGACSAEIERCGELYPGLGQEIVRMEAEEAALRAHSVKRMRALGIEVTS